jgi:hypothetical protein
MLSLFFPFACPSRVLDIPEDDGRSSERCKGVWLADLLPVAEEVQTAAMRHALTEGR